MQIKTDATDGYNAVQVGYEGVAERKITKPELNHLKKADAPALRTLREFKVGTTPYLQTSLCEALPPPQRKSCTQIKNAEEYSPGQQLKVDEIFKVGDKVDVAGTSIGKGFAGRLSLPPPT